MQAQESQEIKESQEVPVGDTMVKIREVAGQRSLVVVDHLGREDVVPVALKPQAKRAA